MKERITITDVAKAVGMSVGTVSGVLGNKTPCYASAKTQEKIRAAAKAMGYRPNRLAQSLKNGRTNTIGVISSSIQNEIGNREVVALINGLLPHGYTTQLIYDRGEADLRKKACEKLIDYGCDAIIIIGHMLYEKEEEDILALPVPVFVLTRWDRTLLPGQTVFLDYRSGCTEALARLTELGHRSILLVQRNSYRFRNDPRYLAFAEHCGAQNPPMTAEECVCAADIDNLTQEELKKIMEEHAGMTAVITTDDRAAMKIAQLMHKNSVRIPEDISIVGFDNIDASALYSPAMSTVCQPVEKAAEELIKLILNKLDGRDFPVQTVVPCYLIERESMGVSALRQNIQKSQIQKGEK